MSEWETVSKSTNDEWETISSDWETVSPSSQQQEQSKLTRFKDSLYDLAEQMPTPIPAIGVEVGASMVSGIPAMMATAYGKGKSLLKGEIS